jgi:hypothetical protein
MDLEERLLEAVRSYLLKESSENSEDSLESSLSSSVEWLSTEKIVDVEDESSDDDDDSTE